MIETSVEPQNITFIILSDGLSLVTPIKHIQKEQRSLSDPSIKGFTSLSKITYRTYGAGSGGLLGYYQRKKNEPGCLLAGDA